MEYSFSGWNAKAIYGCSILGMKEKIRSTGASNKNGRP
jgi:hypothetical protein